jgi:xanthine dehydrogenase iron-sulfur cluster and FAD-binding subunit A
MWQAYYTPATIDEAVNRLAEDPDGTRIVAGATDLILELERGVRPGVKQLVDITRLPGLGDIRQDDAGWIHLGPLVTHSQAASSALIRARAFGLARACWEVGAPQIRNRGTVAGNLITASPANDTIPPLIALQAQVSLRSTSGERTVALRDFYLGVRNTVMRSDEMMVDIAFPAPSESARSTFIKLGLRRAQAISVVNAAVLVDLDGRQVRSAAIALGSVAPVILRATEAEAWLQGKTLNEEAIGRAAHLAAQAALPIDDLRASASYRRRMVAVCVRRGLTSLAQGSERSAVPDDPVMLAAGDGAVSSESASHTGSEPIRTTINGQLVALSRGHDKTLLRLLREDAGLVGTKEGCAEGECGACTVFLDGQAVMACMVPAPRAHGARIETVEGLAATGELHPLQLAFIEEGAVQCGYCTPGFIMAGVKLLEERPAPNRDQILEAFAGNLCRCTGYYAIIAAVERAAASMETTPRS